MSNITFRPLKELKTFNYAHGHVVDKMHGPQNGHNGQHNACFRKNEKIALSIFAVNCFKKVNSVSIATLSLSDIVSDSVCNLNFGVL